MSSHSSQTSAGRSTQSGSVQSSVSSARIAAAAALARLSAEASNMDVLKEIEEEELRVRQRKRECELQLKIAKTAAVEKILADLEEQSLPNRPSQSLAESREKVGQWLTDADVEPSQHVQPQSVEPAQPVQTVPVQTAAPDLQREMIDTMQLPKCELNKFDGDPLKYWVFIRSFDATVGNTCVGANVKLNRLLYYCEGEPLAVIQCCAVMEPEAGYAKARELLRQRFGNDYKISESWVQKLTEGPRVMPGEKKGIQKLADNLRSCTLALSAMNKLEEIDTKRSLGAIVKRLPQYLQSKWRSKAVTILDKTGRYPGVDKLVEFLDKSAREASDPVYGFKDGTREKPILKKGSNFSVQCSGTSSKGTKKGPEQQSTKPDGAKSASIASCPLCKGSHLLKVCPDFVKMSPPERLTVVREKKLCFNCLCGNHFSRKCYQGPCGVQGCSSKHAKMLHDAFKVQSVHIPDDGVSTYQSGHGDQNGGATSYACGGVPGPGKVALPVVAVMVRGRGQLEWLRTYALLDPGSNRSFCSMELVEMLNIHGSAQSMTISTLSTSAPVDTLVVSVDVTADVEKPQHGKTYQIPKVHALHKFPVLCDSCATAEEVHRFDHLVGVPVPKVSTEGVTLLIGQDAPHLLAPLEVRSGRDGEPYAVRTVLGWTINGPLTDGMPRVRSHFVQESLDAQVECLWKMDVGDTLSDDSPSLSINDKRALKIWDDSVQVVDGHYNLAIPFKADDPHLPDNRGLAEKRLALLGKRFGRDRNLHDRYSAEMSNLVAKGYAEKVPEDELDGPPGKTWYLPHHGVLNPNKPEKLRVVFDCAAKCQGRSLNDVVLQGPDLTNKLIGVLLRFRVGQVALMADIEQMFHQVGVVREHRDALRYVWWPNGDVGVHSEVFRMKVHLFGGVWSPSCANYALLRVADDYGSQFDPDVAETVRKNFYVDECLKSVNSEEDAMQLSAQLSSLLSLGGFRLTKWTSNRRGVLKAIPPGERAKEVRSMDLSRGRLPVERALGVKWDTEDDTLGVSVCPKLKSHTRRGLLSVLCSVYDPLGFLCPYVLRAKILFQDECRIVNKGWDDPLESTTQEKLIKWVDDLPKLCDFKVNRCLVPGSFGDIRECHLHHFSDASKDGYGCVSYARFVGVNDKVHCSFIIGKARLSPLKPMTIPRLELSAAVMAVRVDAMLRREVALEIQGSTFWTDSSLVLQYIRNKTKRFLTFVANRVGVIHEASTPDQWRYVSTDENPADDASRGLDAAHLVSSSRWRNGPRFLWKDESCWPAMPEMLNSLDKDREVKREAVSRVVNVSGEVGVIDRLINRYSCWLRLRKAVGWILRFIRWIGDSRPKVKPSGLTVGELRSAEMALVRFVQRASFRQEIRDLCGGQASVRKQSSIYNLRPYLDNAGVLRIGGRLRLAPIEEDQKFPAILPKNHHLSSLVVRHTHESLAGHSGKDHVLCILRRKYWIPQARPLIRRVLKECLLCRRLHGPPEVQRMADLPEGRVTPGKPPFTFVGLDCFGPFLVKRGRSREKRYGCLFTCMATRAIHVEMLHSMEADSFLNCFMRFAARRGTPECLYSDNGTNFVGGQRELGEAIMKLHKDDKVNGVLLAKQITWHFNPPSASHMGGCWERQIRTVRKVLATLLQDTVLDDERLSTLFCEVESIVNDRPITPVSDDPNDLGALTPSHLLKFRPGHPVPLRGLNDTERFRRRWKHVQLLAERFWKRWISEYLPNLQRRQRWVDKKPNLSVGDLVLVLDDQVPRNQWPLARITQTFPGSDGLVRSVEVKTSSGTYNRPVTKLCLLERAVV